MANIERGEVEVTVNGTSYTLRLSMNAAASFETRHKKKIGELVAQAAVLSFTDIRELVWLLLQKHHAAEFKTMESAGELIDDAGGVGVFFQLLEDIINVNKPPADLTAKDGGASDPPTAQADGGGGTSSSRPVASA